MKLTKKCILYVTVISNKQICLTSEFQLMAGWKQDSSVVEGEKKKVLKFIRD